LILALIDTLSELAGKSVRKSWWVVCASTTETDLVKIADILEISPNEPWSKNTLALRSFYESLTDDFGLKTPNNLGIHPFGSGF
jgi:hypothetical protein